MLPAAVHVAEDHAVPLQDSYKHMLPMGVPEAMQGL